MMMDVAEIKEFHFHTYFFQDSETSVQRAHAIYNSIQQLNTSNYFVAVPLKLNMGPVGPHPIGSFETWVPREYFARVYEWFLKNRRGLSIMIHPLTREEVKDHTTSAAWMGEPIPLNTSVLSELLDKVPFQYPE